MKIVHIHHHYNHGDENDSKLDLIISKLNSIMASEQDFLDLLGRIDVATDNIAADLRAIKDQLTNAGLPSSVEESIKAKLEATAVKLEAVAAETPDGEPTPAPSEPTT